MISKRFSKLNFRTRAQLKAYFELFFEAKTYRDKKEWQAVILDIQVYLKSAC